MNDLNRWLAGRGLRTASVLALAAGFALAGCRKQDEGGGAGSQAAPQSAAAQKPASKPEVTILVTGDENGWLLQEKTPAGKMSGGAAQLAGKWVRDEGHCIGRLGADGAAGQECPDPGTLVLSTGDHFNGQAISSFFFGEPTAEVMSRMGYAASGLGNHELDFGVEQFGKLKERGGFPYVGANVSVAERGPKELELPAFKVIERRGINVGVVGLANVNAPKTVMAGRFDGVNVAPYEEALQRVLPEVQKAGADVVVVLADECPRELEALFSAHADWKVDLVVGGHCRDGSFDKTVGNTRLLSPGRRFEKYARAKVTGDRAKPAGQRATAVEASVVEVGDAQPDARIQGVVDAWKQRMEKYLGEEIGFTQAGIDQASGELVQWIGNAWRDTLGADVALINKGGIRQGVGQGPITRADVYSVLPFENSLLLVTLPGEALVKNLEKQEALYTGVSKGPKGFRDAKGRPIDPKATYKVATVEYLYFGGDGFEMEPHDPLPTETGMVWQTPVIEWTRKQQTSEQKPLEQVVKSQK